MCSQTEGLSLCGNRTSKYYKKKLNCRLRVRAGVEVGPSITHLRHSPRLIIGLSRYPTSSVLKKTQLIIKE